ncbi:hypothetical protein CDCA_CDCA01G0257 [Cyanidium caldarium]|uniref:Alpha-MPP n=1 Tax=Cyanidium caldarium TaxID=2771 RepID=A0AAV9IPQ4_CYACA|nr:hypothetical protein CDCA_CDCA01G0257 [Cyanidium caldarium]
MKLRWAFALHASHIPSNHLSRREFLLRSAAAATATALSPLCPPLPALATAAATSALSTDTLFDAFPQARHIHQFTLDNGARFVVLERHTVPLVSLVSYVDVGAVDEPDGQTGMAHFLEHLAFKGTRSIGTQDWGRESALLCQLDALERRRRRRAARPAEDIDEQIRRLQTAADALVDDNAFARLVQRQGGVGLNASTEADSTQYYYNFPSNKLELWFALESERFRAPIFRQFDQERQVILEERRLRVENDDIGQLTEQLLQQAYRQHAYRRPVIGYREDVLALTRADVYDFFDTHYTADRLVFCVVGDVDAVEVRRLAEKYFGPALARRRPSMTATSAAAVRLPSEPPQTAPRFFSLQRPSQPVYVAAYHIPELSHPDTPALYILTGMMSAGRLSRLYQSLVESGMAVAASLGRGFPGDKYPGLAVADVLPAAGVDVHRVADALQEQIARVQQATSISEAELERVRRKTRRALTRTFTSNADMAPLLAQYTALEGDALQAYRFVQRLDRVTAADVARVAHTYLQPQNCTVGVSAPQAIRPPTFLGAV